MTWEIAVGFFTIISTFSAVLSSVMKVNRTLTQLDDSVRQLKDFMERQSDKNEAFGKILTQHELRIMRLEDEKKEGTV
jgi:hypothetical protein